MECPSGFRFGFVAFYTPVETADCGSPTLRQSYMTMSASRLCNIQCDSGSCLSYFPRFCFDRQTGSCQRFIYGGCRGNANNVETLNACKKAWVRESESEEDNEAEDFQCRESEWYTNCNSCSSYFECLVYSGAVETQLVPCPTDQLYNVETKRCDDKCIAQCDQEHAVNCREPYGIFSVTSNCKMYLVCRDSVLQVRRCREGKAFDAERRKCVNFEDTNCMTVSNDILAILIKMLENN